MGTFISKPIATIKANLTGQSGSISVNGVTAASTTTENAAAQINKILNVVNKGVAADGMTRSITQEGGDD